MLKECLEVFKEIIAEDGEDFIIDSHIPANGTYIIIDTSGDNFEVKEIFEIKLDKKTGNIEGQNNIYFSKVRKYDYYSKLIDMNKPIDSKKIIHSNNYLSFYVKKESIGNKKLTNEIIDNYYDTLKDPMKKYSSKAKARLSYQKLEEEIGVVDKDFLEKVREWIKFNVFDLDIDKNSKDYLKIFFEVPIELYMKESDRYLIPNIYNCNDYNQLIDGKIYGLPNDNMGLNAKKPYLENKTRKSKVSYLIDTKEALLQKKFFDYLMSCATLQYFNIYIDTDKDNKISLGNIKRTKNGETLKENDFYGIYLRIQKGKVLEIMDYDLISSYKHELKTPFDYKMYIDLDINLLKNTTVPFYTTYKTKSQIQDILNEVYFSKFLKGNYFTDANDIKLNDEIVKRNLLISRNAIFSWLYKGHTNNIEGILNRVSLQLIKGAILKGNLIKAINQFNLRWSFIEYFKGEGEMADFLNEVRSSLKEKINSKDSKDDSLNKIESDMEYYFAIGQEVYYLLSLSKSGNKNQSLANPFINAKNDDILKEKLRHLYKKYNYSIEYNNMKSSKLYSLILGYKPEGNVNQDMIIAGFLSKSLIYEKKEEREF